MGIVIYECNWQVHIKSSGDYSFVQSQNRRDVLISLINFRKYSSFLCSHYIQYGVEVVSNDK